MIRLDTMEVRLLLPTAAAIAVIIASAVLLALRDFPWPVLGAGPNPVTAELQTVPLPVAVLGAVALDLAWSFVLAGALHAHLAFRVGGIACYALNGLTIFFFGAVYDPLAILLLPVAIASVGAVALGLYLSDRGNVSQAPHLHHRTRLRVPTFGWVLGVTTLLYALGLLGGLREGRPAQFLTIQLELLELLIVPVLFLAGTDFAEWSEVVGGRVAGLLRPLPDRVVVLGIVAAAVAALVWAVWLRGGVHRPAPGVLAAGILPVLVLLVPVVVLGWVSLERPTSQRVPFWALVLVVAVLFVSLLGAALGAEFRGGAARPPSLPPMVEYVHDGAPAFSLEVPDGWRAEDLPSGLGWSGPLAGGGRGRLLLFWSDGGAVPVRALTRAAGTPLRLRPAGTQDGWHTWEAAVGGGTRQGTVWSKVVEGRRWTLTGLAPDGSGAEGVWDAARESWTPGEPAQEEGPDELIPAARYYVPWVGAAAAVLIGLGLLLLLAARGERATAGLFLALSGLFLAAGQNFARPLLRLTGATDPPSVDPQNIALGGAVAALLVLLWGLAVPRHRFRGTGLRLVLTLLLGLLGLLVLSQGVFGTALSAGEAFGVVQGVVLFAAMLWDVLMSGESFTNEGGIHVPRHSRVLIYLGYTIAVVTAVLVLGSLRVEGGGEAAGFESDVWVQYGIEALGAPLLFTFFFVNLRAALGRSPGAGARAGGGMEIDQIDRSVLDEVRPGSEG